MPVTIAISSEKGGVGKTTTTVSIGGEFARRGVSCLVVDFDPQASLTRGLIGSTWTDRLPASATAAALFREQVVDPARLPMPTRFQGLALLPGSRELSEFDSPRPSAGESALFVLRDFAGSEAAAGYDRILIDCPPNLYTLAQSALIGSDYVLTPTFADPDGVATIRFVNETIARVQAGKNPALVQLGILLGGFTKRSAVHIAYATMLRRDFPDLLLTGTIPHAAAFKDARTGEAPVAFHKPRSAAARAVVQIVDELEQRMDRLRVPVGEVA